MTTQVQFPTPFGKFASCDYCTYKLLKRMNALLQLAQVQARRWQRAQRRQPQNRFLVRRYTVRTDARFHTSITRRSITDALVFPLFWIIDAGAPVPVLRSTAIYVAFQADYLRARHPAATPAEALPLSLSAEELAQLLGHLEIWHRDHWLNW
jgi:hypothetical protein